MSSRHYWIACAAALLAAVSAGCWWYHEARRDLSFETATVVLRGESWAWTADDPDLALPAASALPVGAQLDRDARSVHWRPGSETTTERLTVATHRARQTVNLQTHLEVKTSDALPSLLAPPVTEAALGSPYKSTLVITEPAGRPSIRLLDGPPEMVINGGPPGVWYLNWQPKAVGRYPVLLEIVSGDHGLWQPFYIDVTRPPTPPKILNRPLHLAMMASDNRGCVTVRDAAGDPLEFSLVKGPAGMTITTDGELRWTPTPEQPGTHPVVVQVTNADGLHDRAAWEIDVVPAAELEMRCDVPQLARPVRDDLVIVLTSARLLVLGHDGTEYGSAFPAQPASWFEVHPAGYVYCLEAENLEVFKLTADRQLVRTHQLPLRRNLDRRFDSAQYGNRLFLRGAPDADIAVFDISVPAVPVKVGGWAAESREETSLAWMLEAQDGILYAAGSGGAILFDATKDALPVLGRVDVDDLRDLTGMIVRPPYLYTYNRETMRIVDCSDPAHLRLAASLPLEWKGTAYELQQDDPAVVTDARNRFVFGFHDPLQPQSRKLGKLASGHVPGLRQDWAVNREKTSLHQTGFAACVAFDGKYLYETQQHTKVFDLTNPGKPVLLHTVLGAGNRLTPLRPGLVASPWVLYDFSTPTEPRRRGTVTMRHGNSAYTSNGLGMIGEDVISVDREAISAWRPDSHGNYANTDLVEHNLQSPRGVMVNGELLVMGTEAGKRRRQVAVFYGLTPEAKVVELSRQPIAIQIAWLGDLVTCGRFVIGISTNGLQVYAVEGRQVTSVWHNRAYTGSRLAARDNIVVTAGGDRPVTVYTLAANGTLTPRFDLPGTAVQRSNSLVLAPDDRLYHSRSMGLQVHQLYLDHYLETLP